MDELDVFVTRKRDHIGLAMEDRNQATGLSGLDQVRLVHEALPDLNFKDIGLETSSLGRPFRTPFFVSSMTAGHDSGVELNACLARGASEKGWPMGVGSQRRQLFDHGARSEWQKVRLRAPQACFFGNIGIAQLVETKTEKIRELMDSLDGIAMIVHLNALQECLQPEGTPQFKGGAQAIERLVRELDAPVIVKETGCGMSFQTMKLLQSLGVAAIDVGGLGGTHWGRIEGCRSESSSTADTFRNWGIPTVQSVAQSQKLDGKLGGKLDGGVEIWASGGVRTGLDAAKLLALGARMVGFAKPAMEQALKGEAELRKWFEQIEHELRVALFCTGSTNVSVLKGKIDVI